MIASMFALLTIPIGSISRGRPAHRVRLALKVCKALKVLPAHRVTSARSVQLAPRVHKGFRALSAKRDSPAHKVYKGRLALRVCRVRSVLPARQVRPDQSGATGSTGPQGIQGIQGATARLEQYRRTGRHWPDKEFRD